MMNRPLPRFRRASSRGFTLVELIVVIGIIAILAALTLNIAGYVQEKAGNDRAQAELGAIESALLEYKLDYGDYPEGDGSANSTKEVLKLLHPQDGKVYLQSIKAFEYDSPSDAGYYSSNRLIDPFGNPYRYYYNPDSPTNPKSRSQNNGPVEPDIWSYGKKGEQSNSGDTDKWIKNW